LNVSNCNPASKNGSRATCFWPSDWDAPLRNGYSTPGRRRRCRCRRWRRRTGETAANVLRHSLRLLLTTSLPSTQGPPQNDVQYCFDGRACWQCLSIIDFVGCRVACRRLMATAELQTAVVSLRRTRSGARPELAFRCSHRGERHIETRLTRSILCLMSHGRVFRRHQGKLPWEVFVRSKMVVDRERAGRKVIQSAETNSNAIGSKLNELFQSLPAKR